MPRAEHLERLKYTVMALYGSGLLSEREYRAARASLETLGREKINIQMISTSEIKVSCVIEAKYAELAVRVLHEAFGLAGPPASEETA